MEKYLYFNNKKKLIFIFTFVPNCRGASNKMKRKAKSSSASFNSNVYLTIYIEKTLTANKIHFFLINAPLE